MSTSGTSAQSVHARLPSVAQSTGAAFLGIAATVGGMGVLFGRILARLFALPPRLDTPELKRNLHRDRLRSAK